MKSRGFTLVEILVAFGLFVLILGGTLGVVQAAVRVQRAVIAKQAAIGEVTFVSDYMTRAMRGAIKDDQGDCLETVGQGYTFEKIGDTIRFIGKSGQCREFAYNQTIGSLQERISSDDSANNFGAAYNITSNDFVLTSFETRVRGADEGDVGNPDYVHPNITYTVRLADTKTLQTVIALQTTVTARSFEVQQ